MWKRFEWRWVNEKNDQYTWTMNWACITCTHIGDRQPFYSITIKILPNSRKFHKKFSFDFLAIFWLMILLVIRGCRNFMKSSWNRFACISNNNLRHRKCMRVCVRIKVVNMPYAYWIWQRLPNETKNETKSVKLTHVQRPCPNISPAFTFSFIKFLTTIPMMEKTRFTFTFS